MKISYRNQIYNQGSTVQTHVGNNKQSINPIMPRGTATTITQSKLQAPGLCISTLTAFLSVINQKKFYILSWATKDLDKKNEKIC